MLNGLYSAASGMLAQQTRMDMLANDLANVDTTGYKQARIGFRDLIYNTEQGMRIDSGSISADGTVKAGQTRVGKITLVTVTNTAGLTALGNNLFAATGASGRPH